MNLSNILFSVVSTKLNLKVSLLNQERLYVQNLKKQAGYLRRIKENNHKSLSLKESPARFEEQQNLLVMYILNISFLKANTTIHISDTKGCVKLFYSAGSVGLAGKQKKKRRVAVSKLISLLIKKATFLNRAPIALHLNNVNFYKTLIVNRLKRTLYIRVIKSFNQIPYNGCKKRKVRRKKYLKKFR